MKRRHYRIHYTDHAQPMRRIKHKQVSWGSIALGALALLLAAAVVYAVIVWFRLGSTDDFWSELIRPFTGR